MVRKGGGCLGRKREGEEEKREEKEQAEEEGGEGEKDSLPGAFVEVQRRVWPHSRT